jgi:hypothetical protein
VDEFTFKPNYGNNNNLGAFFICLFGVFLAYQGYKTNSFILLVIGLALLLFSVFVYLGYPRQFVFDQKQVTVKKVLLPKQVFLYQDFTDLGTTAIRFGKKSIYLYNMKNGDELIEIFRGLLDRRMIQSSQIEGKLVVEEVLTQKALKTSAIPILIIGFGLLNVLSRFFDLNLDSRIVFLAVFLIIFPSTYYILKRQKENE